MKYQRGDCRNRKEHGLFQTIITLFKMFIGWVRGLGKGGRKVAYIQAPSGPNRHERRREAKTRRVSYSFKGRPGFKLIRRMFRKYGYDTVIALMRGTYRLRSRAIMERSYGRAVKKLYTPV
jgi:hypothetical protein